MVRYFYQYFYCFVNVLPKNVKVFPDKVTVSVVPVPSEINVTVSPEIVYVPLLPTTPVAFIFTVQFGLLNEKTKISSDDNHDVPSNASFGSGSGSSWQAANENPIIATNAIIPTSLKIFSFFIQNTPIETKNLHIQRMCILQTDFSAVVSENNEKKNCPIEM
jgi:hypothetical protein